jgi:F-type H+-transporting ATPase subunit b
MFDLNGTLVIFILSFLLFMMALNEVMLKPVGKVIEARKAKIKADIEAGKTAREDAQQLIAQYEKHVHEVRSNAQGVINEAIEKANYHRNLEMDRLRTEGRQKLDNAKTEIASERDSLIDGLVKQEMDLVQEIGRKLLGEDAVLALDSKKVRRAVEEAS